MALNGGANKYGLGFTFTAKDLTGPVFDKIKKGLRGIRQSATATNKSLTGHARAHTSAVRNMGRVQNRTAQTTVRNNRHIVRSNNEVSSSLKNMESRYMALGIANKAMRFGGALAGGAAGAIIGAADVSGPFTQKMAMINQITRSSQEDMANLKDEIYAVGMATKFTPDEIANATKGLSELGFTAQQSGNSIRTTALLASAGMIDIDQAGRALVGTLNAFHLEADQAAKVGDKLARITQISAFQAKDFQAGLSRAAVVASGYGQNLDDLLATLGALRDSNLKSNVASTGIREMMDQVYGSAKVQVMLEKVGVDVYDKLTKQRRNYVDIMEDLYERTAEMGDKERDNLLKPLLGKRGMQAFIAATNTQKQIIKDGTKITLKGVEAIRYMAQETRNATSTLESMNDAVMDNYEGQKKLFEGIKGTIITQFGEQIEKLLKPLYEVTNLLVGNFAKFWTSIPADMQQGIAAMAAATLGALAFAGAFIALGAAGVSAFIMLSTIAAPILAAAGAVVGVLTAGIVGLVAAIVGLGAAAEGDIGGLGKFFKTIASDARLAFDALRQFFTKGYITGDTKELLEMDKNKGVMRFVQRVVEAFRRVKAFFGGLKTGFQEILGDNAVYIENFKEALSGLGEALGLTTKSMEHLSGTNKGAEESGESWGKTFGRWALRAIDLVTVFIDVLSVAITVGGFMWSVIEPVLKLLLDINGSAGGLVAKIGTMAIGAAWFVNNIAKGIYAMKTIAALSSSSAVSMLATAGVALGWLVALAAVAKVAWEIGTALDEAFKISDRLSKFLSENDVLRTLIDVTLGAGLGAHSKGFGKLTDSERGTSDKQIVYTKEDMPHLRTRQDKLSHEERQRGLGDVLQHAYNKSMSGSTPPAAGVSRQGNASGDTKEMVKALIESNAQLKEMKQNMQNEKKVVNVNVGEENLVKVIQNATGIKQEQISNASWSE